jgi:SAM-dependent methyltransferase
VTAPRFQSQQPSSPASDYSGTEWLRMAEAALRNYNAAIVDELVAAAPPNARILDFGAGIGTLPRGMRNHGLRVDCVELDAAQRAELEADGFRCFAGIADVADGAYDYIYSSNVLEHIEDDVAALRELRRVLAPGGALLLYVPAFNVIYTISDQLIGHHRRYTIPVLRDRLQQANFAIERMWYADFLGFFVTYAFKLLSNKLDSTIAISSP